MTSHDISETASAVIDRHPAKGTDTSRLTAFSDSVIAIILTIMIFNLQPPKMDGWHAIGQMRPTLTAYGLSYLFVAVNWVNHHHLLRYSTRSHTGLVWTNFVYLFTLSFLPVTTSYLASERFSPFSVQIYALSFMPVIASYMALETLIAFGSRVSRRWYPLAVIRGCMALIIEGSAVAASITSPIVAFALIMANTILYIYPEYLAAPGLLRRVPFRRVRKDEDDRTVCGLLSAEKLFADDPTHPEPTSAHPSDEKSHE